MYGIPASLCVGNNLNSNELTVDAICPELLSARNIEELAAGGSGVVVTLDTTNL